MMRAATLLAIALLTSPASCYLLGPRSVTRQQQRHANSSHHELHPIDAAQCAHRTGGRVRLASCLASAEDRPELDSSASGAGAMALSQLIRYPIKSARAERLDTARLTPEGVAGDRRFLVANTMTNTALTQRDVPRISTLEARVEGDTLSLRAGPRHTNVTIQRAGMATRTTLFGESIPLLDQGRDVGQWLAKALDASGGGTEDGDGPLGAALSALSGALRPRYRLLRAIDDEPTGSLRRGAGLSDLAPLLLICEESLALLNSRRAGAGLPPVPMDRFRPNLVVSGCPRPHVEDSWRHVRIGATTLKVSGPCPRCTVPDVAQHSGERDSAAMGPMRGLREYRTRAGVGVAFGIYLSPTEPGATIRVGDAVEAVSP